MINGIHNMDCLEGMKLLKDESINCVVTSPPYWGLRDYEVAPRVWEAISYSPMAGLPCIEIPEWTGCLGLEPEPYMYVGHLVQIFREVSKKLKNDGTVWINIADSYAGSGKGQWEYGKGQRETYIATKDSPQCKIPKIPEGLKPKDLVGIPGRVAFALQADGWYLRSDIIWQKPNAMPESVTDRPTNDHEYIYLLSKSSKYFYDNEAIKEDCINGDPNPPRGSEGVMGNKNLGRRSGNSKRKYGDDRSRPGSHIGSSIPWQGTKRNKRNTWSVSIKPIREAHFATFPEDLIEPCILAGCPVDGVAMDLFMGSGTVAKVAIENQRNYVGFELNSNYCKMAERRISNVQLKII